MNSLLIFFIVFILVGNLAYAETVVINENQESKDQIIVGNQVMITADISNGQDVLQPFAYLTQIRDDDGVIISLSWLTGSLSPRQSFSPAQSWTPEFPGMYTIEIFVWESVDNPEALSPPLTLVVQVV